MTHYIKRCRNCSATIPILDAENPNTNDSYCPKCMEVLNSVQKYEERVIAVLEKHLGAIEQLGTY